MTSYIGSKLDALLTYTFVLSNAISTGVGSHMQSPYGIQCANVELSLYLPGVEKKKVAKDGAV